MKEKIHVREARPEDRFALLSIRKEALGEGLSKRASFDAVDERCWHVIAGLEGRLVGTVRLHPHAGYMAFEKVAVLNSVRGRGVVAEMIRFAQSFSLGKGFLVQKTTVPQEAVELYRMLGWRTAGRPYETGERSVRDMVRKV